MNSRIRTPFYKFFLNPDYVVACSLRSLRSNYLLTSSETQGSKGVDFTLFPSNSRPDQGLFLVSEGGQCDPQWSMEWVEKPRPGRWTRSSSRHLIFERYNFRTISDRIRTAFFITPTSRKDTLTTWRLKILVSRPVHPIWGENSVIYRHC